MDNKELVLLVTKKRGNSEGVDPQLVTWQQEPEKTEAFLQHVTYDPADYSGSEIAEYAPGTPNQANTWPVGATVQMPAGTLVRGEYRQTISEAGPVTLYNDVPGRATPYAVLDNSGKVISAGSLWPTGALRWIKCPTAPNVRDLGGWACDGGTVKHGLLIRGGEPGANDVDVLVNQCGVRHELQLRGALEAPRDYSLLGVGITIPTTYVWYTVNNADESWRTILGCVFERVPSGIPVYVHCSAGADRTGTVICILEALLGVGQSDIDKDYELTCFYTGTATDTQARRRNESGEWGKLITQLKAVALPAGAADTLKNHAVQFALNLGFTAAQINAFRAAMIDGTPAAAAYSVHLSGDHVSLGSQIAGIVAGAPYSDMLTAASNYVIDSVSVLMGGVDVTATAYNESTGALSITSVTGDLQITVTTSMQQATNVFAVGKLNSRLNTSESDPARDGSFIHDFIPIAAEQLNNTAFVLRSNMDIFNYQNNNSGGDYVRFYPSATPGSAVVSEALQSFRSWLSYDAETGVYACTIPAFYYTAKKDQIAYFRFCAQVATTAITESYFDGCVLTINEEITPVA